MYLNTQQIADKLDKSIHTIHQWGARGKLPGRKIGGSWIMTGGEFTAFKAGKTIKPMPLYDARGAAEHLGVTINIVRRLIRNGDLNGQQIDGRGRFGGTRIFTQKQLDKVDPKLLESGRAGRKVKGNPDKYIKIVEGKYVVIGTKNRFGKPFSFTHLFDARGRARKAYGKPPLYWAGEIVDIGEDTVTRAYVVENVTRLDTTALIFPMTFPVDERKTTLILVRKIRGKLTPGGRLIPVPKLD